MPASSFPRMLALYTLNAPTFLLVQSSTSCFVLQLSLTANGTKCDIETGSAWSARLKMIWASVAKDYIIFSLLSKSKCGTRERGSRSVQRRTRREECLVHTPRKRYELMRDVMTLQTSNDEKKENDLRKRTVTFQWRRNRRCLRWKPVKSKI